MVVLVKQFTQRNFRSFRTITHYNCQTVGFTVDLDANPFNGVAAVCTTLAFWSALANWSLLAALTNRTNLPIWTRALSRVVPPCGEPTIIKSDDIECLILFFFVISAAYRKRLPRCAG